MDLCLSGLTCDVVGFKRSYSVIEMTTHLRPAARYFETRPLSVTITLCWRCAQCKSVMYCRASPCRAFTFILIGRTWRIVYAPGHGPFCCRVTAVLRASAYAHAPYCASCLYLIESVSHALICLLMYFNAKYICRCITTFPIAIVYIIMKLNRCNIHNVGSHFITSKTYFPSVYLDNIFMYYNLSNDQKQ
jgi:hypothetical protein